MNKKRVAIIGFGRSGGDIHGAFFGGDTNELYDVVAVVDELDFRRERAKEKFGCDVYADYRELFQRTDIDLVVNASYSYQHYPITLDLLEHGFNVVTEKPFAMHAEECDRMIQAAKDNHVMVCPFQQSHFAPYYRKVREIMDSGILGRIVQIKINFSGFSRRWDWQTSLRFGGGCLRNTGPHPLEQALDILGEDADPTVYSFFDMVNSYGDAEDFAKLLLHQPGKPLIEVEISPANKFSNYIYQVQGSQGTLQATMNEVQYKYFLPEEAPKQKLILESLRTESGAPAYCSETLTWHEETVPLTGSAFDVAVKAYYENIYEHLENGAPLVIRPERIRKLVAIMEEAHRQNPLVEKY